MSTVFIFLPFFLLVLFVFYLFDRIVKLEHSDHKKHWLNDGRPIGFFWVPKESESEFLGLPKLTAARARNRLSGKWFFITPDWAVYDKQASKMFRQYRIFAVLSFSSWLIWGWLTFSGHFFY